jgi:DNA-binding Xre family transcriptional regulator
MGVQYIEVNGQKMAILPAIDLDRLIAEAENRADERAADDALLRRAAGEEYFPGELVDRLMEGENPVAVYRAYRRLTQTELASRIGMSAMVISSIESGRNVGRVSTLRKIAQALSVDLEDILPVEPDKRDAA